MDTFFEQIVPVKRTGKDFAKIAGLFLAAVIVNYFVLLFLAKLFPLALMVVCLVFYGAFKLSKMLFIEYEYIVTNGTLDIDKIIAKSSRKRVMSFEIENISSIEKYTVGRKIPEGYGNKVIACSSDDKNAFIVTASKDGKGRQVLIFAPDDRIKEGIIKSLPKFIANSAFK